MNSKQLVEVTIRGENPGRTPIYGWVAWNMEEKIKNAFGSPENFEDHYGFDMAHVFGGPSPFCDELIKLRDSGEEITPEVFLSFPLKEIKSVSEYADAKRSIDHHKARERFLYAQAPGIFEGLNDVFGIENHLLYMALYPDELKECYQRLCDWNIKNAACFAELGVDCIHVSDDWGAQKSLLFSPDMFLELIYPYHKKMVGEYKRMCGFASLHSDGNINQVLPYIAELGYDFIHPYQESAGMSYDVYLEKYSDKFGILGGVCVQSTLGFGRLDHLKSELERVFHILKGKRWMCCTTHFVQEHCSIEELVYAYDIISELRK